MTSVPSREDAADVMAPQAADADAFQAELEPLLAEAVRLATGMLLNAIEAEDAVQDACVRAWRHRVNRRAGSDLRPWFLAIVANQCREVRRGRWWHVARTAEPDLAVAASPGDNAASIDLRSAIARLPYRRRLVIVLRYYLDLPFEEIAATAGCSIDAAKALARRGAADLQRSLTEGGVPR
jgi:RNA polymerase sigma-70 factor (ECF subfamily)